MKSKRQEKILEIIRQYPIRRQDELIEHLENAGFRVTQATVSRDMKELKLVKKKDAGGNTRYAVGKYDDNASVDQFESLFRVAVKSVDFAGNLVVIRCFTGMAQAVCAAMDAAHSQKVLGTLAGDDTFICILKTEREAESLAEELKNMTGE